MQTSEIGEGSQCPECKTGAMQIKIENCSCHISPPCSACCDAPLVCDACAHTHRDEPQPYTYQPVDYSQMPYGRRTREADLGNGKKLIDFEYDSSSGSTMVYSGKIEGDVTEQDILAYFGSGTFGHRGPAIIGKHFSFTKITD